MRAHTSLSFVLASGLALGGAGCGSPVCPTGPTVNLELQAVAAIPLGPTAPRIQGAEACLVAPVSCSCVTTDSMGFASIPVPIDSEVTIIVSKDGRVSNVAHRVVGQVDSSIAARMTSVSEFPLLFTTVGQANDPTKGHIGIGLFPPDGGDSAGAVLEIVPLDGGTAVPPVYFNDLMFPVPAQTETGSNGLAFFLNVTPGRYEVRSAHLSYCVIESGWPRFAPGGPVRGIELEVRAGMITGASGVQCAFP